MQADTPERHARTSRARAVQLPIDCSGRDLRLAKMVGVGAPTAFDT